MNKDYVLALLAWAGLVISTNALPHGGGLDAHGCHAGSQPYHCHRKPKPEAQQPLQEAKSAVSLAGLPLAAGTAGLVVTGENRCSGYDRGDYPYPQSVERQIVASMGGRIYGPYEGRTFASTRETQIEHIVALSEAHDSGLCRKSDSVKRQFARDLDNLTLASPRVNQSKSGRDAAEWRPRHNACWFASRVVAVKVKYGLTADQKEANMLSSILAGCASTDMRFVAGADS